MLPIQEPKMFRVHIGYYKINIGLYTSNFVLFPNEIKDIEKILTNWCYY